MNVAGNVPPPEFPSTFLPDVAPPGGDLDTLRLIFAGVLYVAAMAAVLYYMIRKLPRAGDASAPGPSDEAPAGLDDSESA